MPNKQKKLKYDPKVMDELLSAPGVKVQADQLTPDELEMFKSLLVSQGTYARYVLEKQKQALKDAWNRK